jgi:hypothetical protein
MQAHTRAMRETTFTAFLGDRRVASGRLEAVAEAACRLQDQQGALLIFDDVTGQPVELDVRGGAAAAAADYRARLGDPPDAPVRRQGRGRPRLGVVAREVTLLPRHWEWLSAQPGGASAALRRLVEEARRLGSASDRRHRALDALYRVMSALAGDAPGFEEASRALFADEDARFDALVSAWPPDVAAYVSQLAAAARASRES